MILAARDGVRKSACRPILGKPAPQPDTGESQRCEGSVAVRRNGPNGAAFSERDVLSRHCTSATIARARHPDRRGPFGRLQRVAAERALRKQDATAEGARALAKSKRVSCGSLADAVRLAERYARRRIPGPRLALPPRRGEVYQRSLDPAMHVGLLGESSFEKIAYQQPCDR
jgi:hypothetical protein